MSIVVRAADKQIEIELSQLTVVDVHDRNARWINALI
jgi:hypothetical protein